MVKKPKPQKYADAEYFRFFCPFAKFYPYVISLGEWLDQLKRSAKTLDEWEKFLQPDYKWVDDLTGEDIPAGLKLAFDGEWYIDPYTKRRYFPKKVYL